MLNEEITYIWDQKPDSFYKELLSYGHYYEAGSMDRWLDKLKILYEAAIETMIEQAEIISEFKEKCE